MDLFLQDMSNTNDDGDEPFDASWATDLLLPDNKTEVGAKTEATTEATAAEGKAEAEAEAEGEAEAEAKAEVDAQFHRKSKRRDKDKNKEQEQQARLEMLAASLNTVHLQQLFIHKQQQEMLRLQQQIREQQVVVREQQAIVRHQQDRIRQHQEMVQRTVVNNMQTIHSSQVRLFQDIVKFKTEQSSSSKKRKRSKQSQPAHPSPTTTTTTTPTTPNKSLSEQHATESMHPTVRRLLNLDELRHLLVDDSSSAQPSVDNILPQFQLSSCSSVMPAHFDPFGMLSKPSFCEVNKR